ncbi:DUF1376 domain-containing protein [Permianibacter fluminis]|uniref:DUF1376 domain-containing protein n=1 Tax=Permianibacter fluminis TaxID=2738515 RepID=UPI002E29ACAC|nr:DUF1376 domain-containing protein [Permianibacter fluminis]
MSQSLVLPNPLTPSDCDLRDFAFMPLDVVRLRDSDIASLTSGDEFRAAVLLWCASWHQVPAASLPDDDVVLAKLAGYGRVVKEWLTVREGALRGWIRCSDGRLYHPVIAEKAVTSWQAKQEQRWKTECARIKKHNQRALVLLPTPTFAEFLAGVSPAALASVPRDSKQLSLGTNTIVPRDKQENGGDVPRDNGKEMRDVPRDNAGCPEGNAIQGIGIGIVKDPVVNTESTDHPSRLRDSACANVLPLPGLGQPDGPATAVPPAPPKTPGFWLDWFNREYGTRFGVRERSTGRMPEILQRWCAAGVTVEQVALAVEQARAKSKGPIADLISYVDATLARMQAAGIPKATETGFVPVHNDFEKQDYTGSALRHGAVLQADGTYRL